MLIVETKYGKSFQDYDRQPSIKYGLRCPLCIFQGMTVRRYDDGKWMIAKCKSCGQWMIVLKEHRNWISKPELKRAYYLMNKYIGPGKFRPWIGTYPEHFHLHWIQ